MNSNFLNQIESLQNTHTHTRTHIKDTNDKIYTHTLIKDTNDKTYTSTLSDFKTRKTAKKKFMVIKKDLHLDEFN